MMKTLSSHPDTVAAFSPRALVLVIEEIVITEETLERRLVAPEPAHTTAPARTEAAAQAPEPALVASAVATVDLPVPYTISPAKPRRVIVQAVLLGAFFLDTLLYTLVIPFLPGRAHALGVSPFLTSMLFAMYAGCFCLATPVAGWLTDRIGARQTLLLGLIALGLATVMFAVVPGLPPLFVARGAQGVAGAVTWTAGLALVAQLFGAEERSALVARILVASSAGTLLGPPLGGFLYAIGGFRAPFLAVAALVLLDGFGRIVFLPRGSALATPGSPRQPNGRPLFRDRHFVTALFVTVAGAALFTLLEPSLPPFLSARFGASSLVIGLIFGAQPLVFAFAQPLVTRAVRRLSAEITITFGLAFGAGALLLLGISSSLAHVLVALAFLAFGGALILLPAIDLLIPPERIGSATAAHNVRYGAIFAAYNLSNAGGMFLGPLLAGGVITWLGATSGFTALSAFPVLCGLVVLGRGHAAG